MKALKTTILTISLVLISITIFSQEKWSVELRPGINFPTSEFDNSNIETGFGFEAAVGYQFMEHLGAYVGWGYNNFQIENSDFEFDETGYTFGFQFIHPIAASERFSYLLRAGGIYNHIELENKDGDLIDDSGHGLGWELGAGINYELGNNWHLRPQIGYSALSRDIELENAVKNIDVNYLVFGLGIAKTF